MHVIYCVCAFCRHIKGIINTGVRCFLRRFLKEFPLEVWIYWCLIAKESLRLYCLKTDTL